MLLKNKKIKKNKIIIKHSHKQRGKGLPNTNIQDLLQKEDSHWSSLQEIFS